MSASNQICPKPFLSKASPGQEYYRRKCSHKNGKCLNERAFKVKGGTHSLCEDHRILRNQRQRESGKKRRAALKQSPGPSYYRGQCNYKTGKCTNERANKVNCKKGGAHLMCEDHRNVHNEIQRKFDRKRRALKRNIDPYYVSQQQPHVARPSSSSMSPSMDNIMPKLLSEMKWKPI